MSGLFILPFCVLQFVLVMMMEQCGRRSRGETEGKVVKQFVRTMDARA